MRDFPIRKLIARYGRIAFLTLLVASSLAGQNAAPKRPASQPYTGDLSVFETPGRDERLQVNRVMDVLGIAPGKSVADIGAGSGWFTVRAARRVAANGAAANGAATNGTGAAGIVYAVDINPDAIRYIDDRVRKESLSNVKTILSKANDPSLPPASVDAVLLLKTYHEIADPVVLLERLRPALRPGARVGIIDRNGNGTDHGISSKIVVEEAEKAGYRRLETYDFVKGDGVDYFLVFGVR
jgi:ubiquinone/menaquinone biosynthesis C-methylase UbiE